MDKPKKLRSKFKCWHAKFHGTCKKCFEVHLGYCYYSRVMNFEPVSKCYRCPICDFREEKEKCIQCSEYKPDKHPFTWSE